MGIVVTNPVDEYDHIFLSELHIMQSNNINTNNPPVYTVSFAYRFYKHEINGDIIFKPGAETEYIEDYYTQAVTDAGVGDMTLISTLTSIQATVAKLINDNTTHVTEIT